MSTTTLSNLYVEKASSEHPLALWMLNETVDYVSQINETQRQLQLFAQWEIENADATNVLSNTVNAPFQDSATSLLSGGIPATALSNIIARSKFFLPESFSQDLANFNIGFYVFVDTALANSVSFGYEYTDPEDSNSVIEVLNTEIIKRSDIGTWKFVSHTFDLPDPDFEDVKLIIKFEVKEGGLAGSYDLLINGLTLGQKSENFNKVSSGINPEPIPSTIALPTQLKVTPAFPYGASGENGYYLSQGSELSSVNFGVPLVYGSSNVTKLSPNELNGQNYPSVIFPGYGFLNERGKNNSYTVEMWLRINSTSSQAKRIFGPISSTDGLYADGGFLTFKVGKSYASHYVGEWFRPMVIHIRSTRNSIIVVLNGEEVINIEYDQDTTAFATELNLSGKSQDWLGIYTYNDINPIDIDTFSIYSYAMPTEVAKRRWVWGQAVAAPEQTNSSINSITAFNDYAFAGYTANYNYPDFANWKQAYFSNVDARDKSLRLPDYALPDFQLGSKTTQELFDDIRAIVPNQQDPDDQLNRKYLTLVPNNTWTDNSSRIYFPKLGVLNDPVQTIYGVFKSDGTAINQPLVKIKNKTNSDYLLVSINGITVSYVINISGTSTTLQTRTVLANTKFSIGLDLSKITELQIEGISRFFSDQSVLDLSLAGDGSARFSGKIYKFGFDAAYNSRKNSDMSDSSGVFTFDYSTITNAVPLATTISTTGTVGSIAGVTGGPWTARVSNLSSLSGLSVGDAITATSGTGSLGSGGSYVVTDIAATSFSFSATGGTIPTAGTITNVKKNIVTYTTNNNFIPTDTVVVSGITPSAYNNSGASVKVISYTNNSFTINSASTGSYVSGGMAVRNRELVNHTANYTLTAIDKYGILFADIAVAGYWEDYMPLTYFGKSIVDSDGRSNYELDAIQFNQDYPEPPASTEEQTTSQWTYSDLSIAYSNPIILSYADLNNAFFTNWDSYLEMSQNSVTTSFYDTESGVLKSYVSFQYVSDGANKNLLDFENYARPLTSGIIDPGAFDLPWETTAFEATTGIIIYPPRQTSATTAIQNTRNVNFEDLAMVYHLDFRSDGILHHPINFKELQMASQVFERTDFTPVGSRFGIPVYYYTKDGIYYDFKAKNPITTYKKSTPHLYLNRQSGWKIRGEFSSLQDRGLAIPVNLPAAEKTDVSSIQMWIRFADRDFPADPIMIFSIDHNEGIYDFFIQADSSGERGTIFGVDRQSLEVLDEIGYYLNGQSVFSPYVDKDAWSVLGLEFPELLKFSSRVGRIDLNGPLTYNNVSYNLATNIEKDESVEARSWQTVKNLHTWEDLSTDLDVAVGSEGPPYNWRQVKIISQSIIYTINPKSIYEKYTGSNRVIIDDESSGVLINPERFKFYNEVSWSDNVKIAV